MYVLDVCVRQCEMERERETERERELNQTTKEKIGQHIYPQQSMDPPKSSGSLLEASSADAAIRGCPIPQGPLPNTDPPPAHTYTHTRGCLATVDEDV